MTTQPPSRPDDVYIAPPMAGEQFDDFAEPPRWPKVIGVISIVWGSLGLCCNLLGGAYFSAMPSLMKMAQGQGQMSDGVPPALMQVNIAMVALCAISLLWAVFLIVSGSALAARRKEGRTLHIAYALGGIVLTALGTYIGFRFQSDINQWVRDNPGTQFAAQQSSGSIMQIAGPIIGAFFGLAWPIFCLVWFLKVKKDAKEISIGLDNRAA